MTHQKRNHSLFTSVSSVALVVALGLGYGAAAHAQSDPPARVGRVAYLRGAVSFRPNSGADWSAAEVNYPVVAGYSFWTDPNLAHADIEVGDAHIHMAEGAEVDVEQLDDQNVIFAVSQGRADITVQSIAPGERYDVQTPRGDVDLLSPGTYRVYAGSPDAPTRVAVFSGQAVFEGPNPVTVSAGLEVFASVNTPTSYVAAPAQEDAYDQAIIQQVQTVEATPVPSGVSYVPGVAELSQYGDWQNNGQYGQVWVPTHVAADWAPYHQGHWAFVQPWGYTWVDDAPWGFAPFHYGRWIQISGRWGWVPGNPGAAPSPPGFRPVYAPALVSFVGNPASLTVGIGGAGVSVGWFPLGPSEPFRPWYPHSAGYVRNVNYVDVNRTVINNINNVTVINHYTYINQRAVTVVPQRAFAGGERVDRVAYRIPPQAFARPIEVAQPTDVVTRILPRHEEVVVRAPGVRIVIAPPRPALRIAPPVAHAAAMVAIRAAARRPATALPKAPPAMSRPAVGPARPEAREPVAGAPEAVRPEPKVPVVRTLGVPAREAGKPVVRTPGVPPSGAGKPMARPTEGTKPETHVVKKPPTVEQAPPKVEAVHPVVRAPETVHQAPPGKPEGKKKVEKKPGESTNPNNPG